MACKELHGFEGSLGYALGHHHSIRGWAAGVDVDHRNPGHNGRTRLGDPRWMVGPVHEIAPDGMVIPVGEVLCDAVSWLRGCGCASAVLRCLWMPSLRAEGRRRLRRLNRRRSRRLRNRLRRYNRYDDHRGGTLPR